MTKPEILSILTYYFDKQPPNDSSKGQLVMILHNCTEVNPDIIGIELISDAPTFAAVPPHVDEVLVNPAVVAMGPVDGQVCASH